MREMRWPPARAGAGLLVDKPRLHARAASGLGQTLISGDLVAAVAAVAPGAPMLGLYALAPEGAHALRIGRLSALLVTPAPLLVADGWREGWCATAVDDGWAAIDLSGADAPQALAQGTSADLAAGFALGRRRLLWAAVPIGADGGGIPAARRGAVARDALDLARRRLTAGSTYVLRMVVSPPNFPKSGKIPPKKKEQCPSGHWNPHEAQGQADRFAARVGCADLRPIALTSARIIQVLLRAVTRTRFTSGVYVFPVSGSSAKPDHRVEVIEGVVPELAVVCAHE